MTLQDRDTLLPAATSVAPLPAGRPAWDLRLGLGALVVVILAAVTLGPATRASTSAAQGGPVAATPGGATAALVNGLRIFVSDPASAALPVPEAVLADSH